MVNFYTLFNVHDPFDPTHRFSTSWLLSPSTITVIRLILALHGIIGIIINLILPGDVSAGASFSYFTNITYWGLTSHFLFARLHSLSYTLHGRAWLEKWPKWLQMLHGVLHSTIVTFPFLGTIVFWAIQYQPEQLVGPLNMWSNISCNVLNSVLAVLEIVVPRTDVPLWIHLPCILVILGGYACIASITNATQGFYTYGFLDANKYHARALAGHLIGIAAGCGGIFILVRFLIKARIWVVKKEIGDARRAF